MLRLAYWRSWPAHLWELYPNSCRARSVQHRVPILPPSAAGLRLGFASDLHIGPTTPSKLLEAAFEQLAEAKLDVLLLGGDYVFLDATERTADTLAALVRAVPAARKYAVLGNHDLWTQHVKLERGLRDAGVTILINEHTWLAPDVALVGLDDPWTAIADCMQALQGAGAPPALVVLCHSPDGLPSAQRALEALSPHTAGLFVCGHTHGGQIATPWARS